MKDLCAHRSPVEIFQGRLLKEEDDEDDETIVFLLDIDNASNNFGSSCSVHRYQSSRQRCWLVCTSPNRRKQQCQSRGRRCHRIRHRFGTQPANPPHHWRIRFHRWNNSSGLFSGRAQCFHYYLLEFPKRNHLV